MAELEDGYKSGLRVEVEPEHIREVNWGDDEVRSWISSFERGCLQSSRTKDLSC